MASFTVDPASLGALASTLSSLGGEMQAMKPATGCLQGALGGRALQEAVESFAGDWSYGIGLLESHMRHVVENLSRAAGAYERSDSLVADACRPGGG